MSSALLWFALAVGPGVPTGARADLPAWVDAQVGGKLSIAAKAYKRAIDPDYRRFSAEERGGTVADGPLAGQWVFIGVPGSQVPTSAWRMRLPTTTPYRVKLDLYCVQADCEALLGRMTSMRAPAVHGNAALVAEWEAIVQTEACEKGLPRDTPAPSYPREELRRGISGDVTIGVFYNACGEVRSAWVVTSSGNHNLDRATVRQAVRWRVVPGISGRAGRLQTTVTFSAN